MAHSLEFNLLVAADVEPSRLDELTRQLLGELRASNLDTAGLGGRGAAPAGAKSGELVALGAIIVALAPTALPGLIAFLKDWCLRARNRSVKISRRIGDQELTLEYDVRDIGAAEISELIDVIESKLK